MNIEFDFIEEEGRVVELSTKKTLAIDSQLNSCPIPDANFSMELTTSGIDAIIADATEVTVYTLGGTAIYQGPANKMVLTPGTYLISTPQGIHKYLIK